MKAYLYLFLAVLLGFVGSVMLKLSDGFTVLVPTVIFLISYSTAFYCFSIALKTIQLFVGYAVWSALSTVGNAFLGVYLFDEGFNIMKVWAIGLIMVGIVLIQKREVVSQKSLS